jgi:hypothetical protein
MTTTMSTTSTPGENLVTRLAWPTAWFALVAGQLHALARHRTVDGSGDLDAPLVAAWSDPARELLGPLLDWASPDTVYLTYGKLWLPVFLVFTATAFVVRRHRSTVVRGAERWAWRVVLPAYVLACACVALEYWTQWGAMDDDWLDLVFLASIPVMLVTVVGSTFLGLVLVRRRVGLPAWLLAATLPGLFAITAVTSLGNVVLPIAFGFGLLGRRLRVDSETRESPAVASTSA